MRAASNAILQTISKIYQALPIGLNGTRIVQLSARQHETTWIAAKIKFPGLAFDRMNYGSQK